MKYLIFLLLTSSVLSLSAQSNGTYRNPLNSFLGEYEGYINYSSGDTSTQPWFEYTFNITYDHFDSNYVTCSVLSWETAYKVCEDSILISHSYDDSICESADSLFENEFGNFTYKSGFAKLYPDSTLIYWYWTPPVWGDTWCFFKGKKTKSYASINNNTFSTGSVELYPNPAVNKLTIITKENLDGIEFYNLSGVMIKKIPLEQNQKEIDVSAIPKGLYFYKVFLKNNKSVTGKVILLK